MIHKYWLILACSGIFQNVLAADKLLVGENLLMQKIDKAIVKFERTQRENWAYQVNRYENEEGDITSSVERFAPNTDINSQWTLLSQNGDMPTKKQLKKFAKEKESQAKKQEKGANYSLKLREIINLESLTLQADTGSHITAGFEVHLRQLGEDSKGKLEGTLLYNKAEEFIEELTIVNNTEFSPMFSASIAELTMTFNFIKIDTAILPKQHKLQMKGTFAYFTQIDEESNDTYSNYQLVSQLND